jgi:hypothetical protein
MSLRKHRFAGTGFGTGACHDMVGEGSHDFVCGGELCSLTEELVHAPVHDVKHLLLLCP